MIVPKVRLYLSCGEMQEAWMGSGALKTHCSQVLCLAAATLCARKHT